MLRLYDSRLMKAAVSRYELQEREHLFHTVFENSPDAIFIEDLNGNVLEVNPAACRLHGLSREELVGKNVSELVPPEYRDSVVHQNRMVDGEVEGFSLGPRGQQIPVSIRSSAIAYMGGTAILLQVRDITERRRTEEALRESESRYRLLFDCNPQPMWVHDMETRCFLAVNEAALRLYRFSRDEFLLMDSINAILADPRPVESGMPILPNLVEVTSARHRRKDGGTLNVELTQHTMTLDGRIVAFVMISRVISANR
jgi:PAS domain S-box-containing protein